MMKIEKVEGGYVVSGKTLAGEDVLRLVTGTRAMAKAWAEAVHEGRAIGGVGGEAQALKTFEDAAMGYMAAGRWLAGLDRAMEHFGDQWVGGITGKDVLAWAKGAYDTPSMVNRMGIAPVRAVLNWAEAEGWRDGKVSVRQVKETKRVKGVAPEGWIEAFMAQAERMGINYLGYADLALMLLTTGRRTDELLKLRWSAIDWGRGVVRLARTKNGDDAVVALHPVLLQRLRLLRAAQARAGADPAVRADTRDRLTCGRVFGIRVKTQCWTRWSEICEAAGIEKLTPHASGRHTFATRLDDAGVSASAIAALGGWKSVRMVQEVYIHNTGGKRDAAEIVAGSVLGKVTGLREVK